MKNKFALLLKYDFLKMLGRLQGKKNRKSTLSALSLMIVGVVGIFILYYFQTKTMFDAMASLGIAEMSVYQGFMMCLSVNLILGVMLMGGTKTANDTDLLMSLPLKKRDIVLSKMVGSYVFDLFFSVLLLAPYVALYTQYAGFDIITILLSIVVALFLPLMSVGLTYICNFVIYRAFNKSKYSGMLKSFVSLVFFVVVIGLVLIQSFTAGFQDASSLEEYFSKRAITYELLKLVLYHNYTSLIWLALITVLPFVVGVGLYVTSYGKPLIGYKSKNNQLAFTKKGSRLSLMFKKEISFYASTPVYVSNTLIGPIGIIAIAILVLFNGAESILSLFGMGMADVGAISDILTGVLCVILSGLISMSGTTNCSISLEGKSVWILKSTPINLNLLMIAKALVTIVLIEPSVIVFSLVMTIALKLSFVEFLFLLILPTLTCLFVAFAGLLINLLIPKIEWEDETQVVKQSMSVLVGMLLTMVYAAVPIVFFLALEWSTTVTALCTLGVYVLIDTAVIFILFTRGKKLFAKL